MGAMKSFNLDKVVGGEEGIIYAQQGSAKSNSIITSTVQYTLTIDGVSYASEAEPTSNFRVDVGDQILVYTDGTNNTIAYLTSQGILKAITTEEVVPALIKTITVNGTAATSLIEKNIQDGDIIVITVEEIN